MTATKKNEEVEPLIQKSQATAADDPSSTHVDGYALVPLIQRHVLLRLDVGPFLVLYGILLLVDYSHLGDNHTVVETQAWWSMEHWIVEITFPLVLILHLTLFLLQQWNVFWRATIGFAQYHHSTKKAGTASTLPLFTHCLVQAPTVDQHHSAHEAEIVSVQRTKEPYSSKNATITWVVNFQDVLFRCRLSQDDNDDDDDDDVTLWQSTTTKSKESKRSPAPMKDRFNTARLPFHRVRYPIHEPLSFYVRWKGHSTMTQLLKAQRVYGSNATPIELPTLGELLQGQVVAPFFLFQVFCVLLWSLDEYWYYAIFTFLALLLFETTQAYTRLKNLERLRSHSNHSHQQPVYVYRPAYPPGSTGWISVLATELVPGDIVSCQVVTKRRGDRRSTQDIQHLNRLPADVVVLQGDAVVDESLLTGESIPQLKAALECDQSTARSVIDLQEQKSSILFGGTTLLVSHAGEDVENEEMRTSDDIPAAPNKGVVGIVVRTGFETVQGSLLRTMAHTQKSVDGVHTNDTYIFILMLLCCAVASAAMVLAEGWGDPIRNRFRLVLHVIIIVTSVVPPELPMELSLAATNSLADLMKKYKVYCTEVFRIPLAGQVNVCCFDKTGTLTSDEMKLTGVRCLKDGTTSFSDVMKPGPDLPWPILRIMTACNSLATNQSIPTGIDGMANLIGDPLEKAILKDTGFRHRQNNVLQAQEKSSSRANTVMVLHRFGFTSRLKRMSVLVREDNDSTTHVLTKGAPEVIKKFLKADSIPPAYDEISMHHMGLGQRVLALAYKSLSKAESSSPLKSLKRDDVESSLLFAGFLLLDCPVKSDSEAVISELWQSGHSTVMITGDALLTANSVAGVVGITRKNEDGQPSTSYKLRQIKDGIEKSSNIDDVRSSFAFVPLDNDGKGGPKTTYNLGSLELADLKVRVQSRQLALCIAGDTLTSLVNSIVEAAGTATGTMKVDEKQLLFHPAAIQVLQEVVPLVSVFARHAPRQKEAIIAAFNAAGYNTLMCGDGTNDVGALRRAHVGISLISAPEVESKQRAAATRVAKLKKQQRKDIKAGRGNRFRGSGNPLQESLLELQEAQEELDRVELGDASIASPFTSRGVSIKCCKNVLRQGRCTLVTMLQIYKILGINCLVNAMVLSKLYLHGVKNGDRQLTILGVGVAVLFLFVTRGKPLPMLSPSQPPSSVMCAQALISIAVQFGIHFVLTLTVSNVSLAFVDPYDPSMIPDGPFNPNTLNTCTFLMSAVAAVNTFAVNYRGEPFVEPLRENKFMLRTLQISYAILFTSAAEAFPPLNDLFQLSELPVAMDVDRKSADTGLIRQVILQFGFSTFLIFLMLLDTVLVFAAEHVILKIFEPTTKKPLASKNSKPSSH